MGCIRRTGFVALVLVGALAATACSDDGDDRSDPARSSRPATATTAPGESTTPPENATCALVTPADLDAVFDRPAEESSSTVVDEDTVCRWSAGGQSLEFRLHEGSSLSTSSSSSSPINISVQRGQGGRVYGFVYLSDSGDADTKGTAVNDLADSVIARVEEGD